MFSGGCFMFGVGWVGGWVLWFGMGLGFLDGILGFG